VATISRADEVVSEVVCGCFQRHFHLAAFGMALEMAKNVTVCTEQNENYWSRNRRAHFVLG
jgi:hypothetical protein